MKRIATAVLLILTVMLVAKNRSVPDELEQKYFGSTPIAHDAQRMPRRALDDVYSSGIIHQPIPDLGTMSHTLPISSSEVIEDCNIYVRITHSWIRDLRLTVTHLINGSEADTVIILDTFPGDSIVNMDVWFDSDADSTLAQGLVALPIDSTEDTTDFYLTLSGTLRPQFSLDSLNEVTANGEWILTVVDRFALDTGFVEEWAVEINPERPLRGTITDGNTLEPVSSVRVQTIPATSIVTSNSEGVYGFDRIPNGTYELIFTKEFYDTLTLTGITIDQTIPQTVDVQIYPFAAPHTYVSADTVISIPDNSAVGARLILNIRDSYSVADLDITVNLTHQYVSDLKLTLSSPAGESAVLVPARCISPTLGQNFTDCTFDDEAELDFLEEAISAPFTGIWQPAESLAVFDGRPVRGNWTLLAVDSCEADTGQINNFTLHVIEPLAIQEGPQVTSDFGLFTAYPNPFNSSVSFTFSLAVPALVALNIYDINGRLAQTITHKHLAAGTHHYYFTAENLASGIYFATLITPVHSLTQKIIFLK